MTRVTDDLHRMVDYIPDLRNIMMIGLDLLTIIGILILIIGLALLTIIGILILIIGLALLTVIKIMIFLVLKRRDEKQERRGPQPPSPLPSESVKSEQNYSTTFIMNDDHICIPNSQLTIPMITTPTTMPYYSDSTAAAYDTPPLTTSAAAGTPSISSLIDSEDPSMIKARVFVGNLKTFRVSREDLVELFECCGNVLGATLFKGYALIQFLTQTEAELSVQILNGYTWEGSTLDVKILKLQSTKDGIDRSKLLNVHIHNSCEPVFNRATNTAHSLAAFAGENRHPSVNFAPAGPMGGGSSTMTAVGAPMGGGGSSSMTDVGGAGGGGAPSAPVDNSNVSRTYSQTSNTAHSLAALAGENRLQSVNFDRCH